MASNILSIGQSALAAAQAGISTTGNNIANAATPGYSRQVVVQSAALPQNYGYGFLGQGTQIDTVKRIYNDFQATQIRATQSAKSGLDSYYAQIQQVDNMLADPSAGLSPALQDFFKGVQDLAANPASVPSRQAALSAGQSLATRFQGLNDQLDQMNQGVNSQIASSVNVINTYAQKIAQLNDAITQAQGAANGQPANDLLDQRDQLMLDLSKEIKATVVKQDDGKYNVFIGNGQPLVIGNQTFALKTTVAPTDPTRTEVAYATNGNTVIMGENSLTGGKLGGLLDFRSQTLDNAQNALGRVAIGLASTFNAQHRLGQDLNGNLGGDFFTVASPRVSASTTNIGTGALTASISNASALTASDYRLNFDGSNYQLTRMTDGAVTTFSAFPQTIDGVSLSLTGAPAAGDSFLIRPTVEGAKAFNVAISDTSLIAAAAPIRSAVISTNTGTGSISAGSVNAPPPPNANLQQPVTITFTSATTFDVNGTGTGNPTGLVYTPGANISYNGWSAQIAGAPASSDSFSIGPNTGGVGDSRNALLLAALQTSNTLAGGSTTYQGAYSQLVSSVGNKAHELNVSSTATGNLLTSTVQAQQSESGVNLDEEATNLLRYQQAYQAAGKVMQIASQLFNTLLTLGN
ncbi:flagellar hook-associated protein FlgK [Sulfuriferula sp.]|uniref:flagellar hook-associated protein FlgK n=1 Tax=Sulfuriferula sp. TaxID=2025307 RepID=UPI00272F4970|nr:flagellar hook-associated protein FlgK [Sulfuriferula sp.]MDP2025155.1 flagellar hook-associated protein FlgK [Sulfuriferula sp.]